MIGLNIFFWFMVILFAIIGAMRGWAKELLVFFSVILSLFVINVLQEFAPFVQNLVAGDSLSALFWLRIVILTALVFFGYQGPNLSKLAATNKFNREKFQDALLGAFLGAINGFFIFGAFLFYLNEAEYSALSKLIMAPDPLTPTGAAVYDLIKMLPPTWLLKPGSPFIYFAVAIAFAFVLVVFL
ncbi:MAG: CvpA family protein [Anaerolineaceae bacterium]|nr:CvpA family protein [Anaerolineaceae bacterium]